MLRTNCFVILLLAALLLGACQPVTRPAAQEPQPPQGLRFDAPEYAVDGPYAVGVRYFTIPAKNEHDRELTATVWYPAKTPEAGTARIAYEQQFVPGEIAPFSVFGNAVLDSPPDAAGAPYPLVVHSHAHWSYGQEVPYLLEHLASQGFVVMSVDHEDNWSTAFGALPYQAMIRRPQEVTRQIDFAEGLSASEGNLTGIIDTRRVGITGYSLGGETALAVGGARWDLDNARTWCADNPRGAELNAWGCTDMLNKVAELAAYARLDVQPVGLWPSRFDPRIGAVVSLAGPTFTFGSDGMQSVDVPVMFMVGSGETSVDPAFEMAAPYESVSSARKAKVVFDHAEHLVFFSGCDDSPSIAALGFPVFCTDPVWDMDRAHDLINHFATAFLLAELKGDAKATAALASENVSFPGVKYEATGYDTPAEPEAAAYTPLYEPAECNYPVPEGEMVECGYLIVPEDRSRPDSPAIRLHVVNYKSKSATPKPDPIFVVHGGPGADGGVINWLWTNDPTASAFRADRDNIYLEYRGSNFSEPAFYCPEMEADLSKLAGMSFDEEVEWSASAIQACAERTIASGHNLSAYYPLAAAADLADLRIALGYDTVNVYAVSYGTVLTMLWMQHFPEGLGSIVLDSVGPPDVNWINAQLEVVDGAFDALFRACAADPTCSTAYPDLEQAFYAVLAQLRVDPVSITVQDEAGASYDVVIDDLKFVSYAREGMFIGDGFTSIPAGIYAAYQGDFTRVAQAWLEYLAGRHGATGPGSGAGSQGVYYTMMCTHYGSFTDLDQANTIYDAVGADPSVHDWAVTYILTDTLAACQKWNVQPPAPNVWEQAVESDRPVLMLVGTYDSDSAPLLSASYVDAFANGYYYELSSGHALLFTDCGLDLIEQFFANPTHAPDTSCVSEMKANWVLP